MKLQSTSLTVKKQSGVITKKLAAIEKRIGINIKAAWYQNGLLLMQIRDEELYKRKYGTFENYLIQRWDFSRQRGYQMLNASELTLKIAQNYAKILSENGAKCKLLVDILPTAETHIRPLLDGLKNDSERVKVWGYVIDASKLDDIRITQAFVQSQVDAFIESGEVIEDVEYTVEVETVNLSTGVTHSSTGANDWYTPTEYIEAARLVLGCIDLDPASSDHAQLTVKAGTYYTTSNTALDKEWKGRVFLNPPYSMPEIKQFTDKLIEEVAAGRVTEAIVLTNNSSDTSWFHSLIEQSSAICLTRGRVQFYSLDNATMATRQGQCFFYIGKKAGKFIEVFRQYGAVLVNA